MIYPRKQSSWRSLSVRRCRSAGIYPGMYDGLEARQS